MTGAAVAGTGDDAAELRTELLARCRAPDAEIDDETFDRLALRAFAYQFAHNVPYAAYCRRRGVTPDTTAHWTDVPAVPAAAFKAVPLSTGDPARAQAVFRTSGTTAGREQRGARYMLDLTLYHAAALPFFQACVLPDAPELPCFSLVPRARELPESSLAHMIDLVCVRLGAAGSSYFASVGDGLRIEPLIERLDDCVRTGQPVCLLGTSLAYLALLDELERRAVRLRLPAGSRLMDTGGYKGSGREIAQGALRARYAEQLGLDASHCVNEYGMTELCSQFYDASLRDAVRHGAPGAARKIGPPWVRTRVVDPVSLEPVDDGRTGILRHVDLANLDAVIAVQTEDVGRAVDDGFELLGRQPGAAPRGCSIALDELLRAVRTGV